MLISISRSSGIMFLTVALHIFLFAGSVLSSVLPADSGDGATSVAAVFNSKYKPNFQAELRKVAIRHGVQHDEQADPLVKREPQTGTAGGGALAMPINHDHTYVVPVDIGTPPQRVFLNFDTGSSNLWVYSTEMPKNQSKGHHVYDPKQSKTSSRYSGETWHIRYFDGLEANGSVYWDRFAVGPVAMEHQAIGVAQSVSRKNAEKYTAVDGLLGLSVSSTMSNAVPNKAKTWFENVRSTLKEPLFTANLYHQANGTYNFGYVNSSEHTGNITYTPLLKEGWVPDGWWMKVTGFGVGNNSLVPGNLAAVVDTGTSFILIDDNTVIEYYKKVSGAVLDAKEGMHIFPCSSQLPDFSFGVETARITVPGRYVSCGPATTRQGYCQGGIQSAPWGAPMILGDVAIKSALVVFDVGQKRIGWASKQLPA